MGGRRLNLHPATVPYQILLGRGIGILNSMLFFGFLLYSFIQGSVSLRDFLLYYAGFMGVVFAGYIIWEVLFYSLYEFGFSDDRFEIHSGVFFRRKREIPVDRIQNIDVSRNILQRLLGLSELRIESAGGGETEAILRYVEYRLGEQVKSEINRRIQDTDQSVETDETDDATETRRPIFQLSGEEIFLLCLCSLHPRMAFSVFFILPAFFLPLFSGSGAMIVVLILFLVFGFVSLGGTWALQAAKTFERYYGYTLYWDGDKLEYTRGLLNRRSGQIPIDKIQKLNIRENAVMRFFGFASLNVETAGYSPGTAEERGSEAAIPLARKNRVVRIAAGLSGANPPALSRPPSRTKHFYAARYTTILLIFAGLFYTINFFIQGNTPAKLLLSYAWTVPASLVPSTPIMAIFRWRHLGYQLQKDHFVTREGFWVQSTVIVPYFRTQNFIAHQSVFQRFWNLSTFTLDTAGSSLFFASAARAVNVDGSVSEQMMSRTRTRFEESLAERVRKKAEELGNGDEPSSTEERDAGSGPTSIPPTNRQLPPPP